MCVFQYSIAFYCLFASANNFINKFIERPSGALRESTSTEMENNRHDFLFALLLFMQKINIFVLLSEIRFKKKKKVREKSDFHFVDFVFGRFCVGFNIQLDCD